MPATPLAQVAVHLRPQDNVAVAARPLAPGLEVQFDGQPFAVQGRVGLGHKLAVRPIAAGEPVLKYGQVIGFAAADVPAGAHVHVHTSAPTPSSAITRSAATARPRPPPPSRAPSRATTAA